MNRNPRSALLLTSLFLALLAAAFTGAQKVRAYSDQPPAKRTGAPTENTCLSCHGGSLNDGVGSIQIVNAPAEYVPGVAYEIQVAIQRPGQSRWGFELTCLTAASSAAAGTITDTTPLTATQVSSGKTYITQTTQFADGTFAGTADGPVGWTFQWVAPAAGTGEVVFYAAGVAADNSGDNNGDFVYSTSFSSLEHVTTDASEMSWGQIKARYVR